MNDPKEITKIVMQMVKEKRLTEAQQYLMNLKMKLLNEQNNNNKPGLAK